MTWSWSKLADKLLDWVNGNSHECRTSLGGRYCLVCQREVGERIGRTVR